MQTVATARVVAIYTGAWSRKRTGREKKGKAHEINDRSESGPAARILQYYKYHDGDVYRTRISGRRIANPKSAPNFRNCLLSTSDKDGNA